MSGGLTPCRQLRPSSRQEHVRALNYSTFKLSNIQTIKQKQSNIQTTHKSLYSAAAFKKSKITSGLSVVKGMRKHIHWIRMMVYDAVVNQVPTTNIPTLIQKFFERSGITLKDGCTDFHRVPYQNCCHEIINNISNTLTDRVAVNHAAIQKINETWDKSLNELNCHLHPLDTIASSCRAALKALETEKGQLYGKDCMAGNLVLQMNKMRYKDGKGDPKGFTTFLDDHKLPRRNMPRYRGNRLHILFHICGKFIEHYDLFLKFLRTGTVSCGGLQASIRSDFANETAKLRLQVLGLLGKLLSGPWMQKFYTSAESQIDHTHGITVVRDVVSALKESSGNPIVLLTRETDFFENRLDEDRDPVLKKLRQCPSDDSLRASLCKMIVGCLTAVIAVLERQ